jgi:hypothetical protein
MIYLIEPAFSSIVLRNCLQPAERAACDSGSVPMRWVSACVLRLLRGIKRKSISSLVQLFCNIPVLSSPVPVRLVRGAARPDGPRGGGRRFIGQRFRNASAGHRARCQGYAGTLGGLRSGARPPGVWRVR